MTVKETGSPNRREEGSNAGCLALQSGEEVTWTPEMKSELDFAIEYYELSCTKEVAEFERDCITEYEHKIELLREGIEQRASEK